MIDQIEALRDAADATDTRIRLIPDALGPVDMSVRRDGDAVQVHFTATEAATRQLIADAQPRLAELADARGIRIERATVDGGARPVSRPAISGQRRARRRAKASSNRTANHAATRCAIARPRPPNPNPPTEQRIA